MKYLVVLIAFATAVSANWCPKVDDPRHPVHLPHATECGVFWKCLNGIPHLLECSEGLHWSIESNWCDYPENAKCIRPLAVGGSENGNSARQIEHVKECPAVENPSIPTHLPHSFDCTKFWKCLHGIAYAMDCPVGQHWNIEKNWCDYPENAKCKRPLQNIEQAAQTGTETKLIPNECPTNENAAYPTHMPHATDCDKFWKCWNGVPYLQYCPAGQYWSIEHQWCDYSQYAQCVRPLPKTFVAANDYPIQCPAVENPALPTTYLPHTTDCTKFWKCFRGQPYLSDCPPGLHWNIEKNWCDFPANAKCVRPLFKPQFKLF